MSWRELTTETPTHVKGVTLRITRKGYDNPKLVIRIARDIAGEAALPVDAKARVKVFIGEGGDAGKMRLTAGEGHYTAYPVGKAGALKIAVTPPLGAPGAEYPTTAAEYTVTKGGLNFALPWHRKAADREVDEEIPPLPPGWPSTEAVAEACAVRTESALARHRTALPAPPTLDEIEEDATPDRAIKPERFIATGNHGEAEIEEDVRPAPQLARDLADIATKAEQEKPAPARRHHVYADTTSAEATRAFSHNGKHVMLTEPEYAVAHRLYKVMRKGIKGQFLDAGVISSLTKAKDIAVRNLIMTRLTEKLAQIGLAVRVQQGLGKGWWMEEG